MIKVEQKKFSLDTGWETLRTGNIIPTDIQLVLVFGSRALLQDATYFGHIRKSYPKAAIVMSSTAGEIIDTYVNDDSLSLTALHFEHTRLKTVCVSINDPKDSFKAGYRLASALDTNELTSLLIISDGQKVNGSDLLSGLQEFLPPNVIITGGLAGDGAAFQTTLVGLNAAPVEGKIVVIGFYGDQLSITHGCVGGWDPFGVERLITKSEANVLYELDGKPALDIYKMYLGEYAKDLPGSGLLFPLSIRTKESEDPIVRTILAVNDEDKSLTFAGNMPKGAYAQLMKANFDRLIEGAAEAALQSIKDNPAEPDLAILISCVGRKLLLGQRIEEEVEVIRNVYGNHTAITGFYSYGEISPSLNIAKCELHNQTMTITALREN